MKTIAIIVAGGKGKRMGRPKQFIKISGRPMLAWTLAVFQKAKIINGIILVVASDQLALARRLPQDKIIAIVPGGSERQDSVRNGLLHLPDSAEIVLIHDGARPLVTDEIIKHSVEGARKFGAAVVGVPVKDTLKVVSCQLLVVSRTLNRDQIWAAQTPQVFRKDLILKAYQKGYNSNKITDDSMLVEWLGVPVKMVLGAGGNIKVTTPEDLKMAEALLKGRRK